MTAITCDHTDDAAVAEAFAQIERAGGLDVLVNVAWGGYERMLENGRFTFGAPFWEQPVWRWDAMMTAGVRAAFVASQHAARLMIPARRGLIVNISFWAAQKHIANALYGVSKAATDKLTADMAHELKGHGVTAVSLYPGLVRTEAVLAAGFFDSEQLGESRVRRPRRGGAGRRSGRRALDRDGARGGGARRGIRVRGHRWQAPARADPRGRVTARGRSASGLRDPEEATTETRRHGEFQGFLGVSVSLWPNALRLAGRVDFHHGLLSEGRGPPAALESPS